MMSLENSSITEGGVIDEFHAQVQHLKEEIRSTFMRHRKSLTSRELWLLDQADSIKDVTTTMLMRQQMSLADAKARIDQCTEFLRFSKDEAYPKGIQHASNLIMKLKKCTAECPPIKDLPLPEIKFVHNRSQLRNCILHYGKLDTSLNGGDDAGSDHSWDLMDEKVEDCSERNECTAGMRFKQVEIEDMDFLCISDARIESSSGISALGQVCRANEICDSISDCVCDAPCYLQAGSSNQQPQQFAADPVKELSGNLARIFNDKNNCPKTDEVLDGNVGGVNICPVTEGNNPLAHMPTASKTWHQSNIPLTPSFHTIDDNCFLNGLSRKLQCILDGGKDDSLRPSKTGESLKLADTSNFDNIPNGNSKLEFNSCEDLHGKIQGILDCKSDPSDSSYIDGVCNLKAADFKSQQEDLVDALHGRLQGIIDGTIDHGCHRDNSGDFKMPPLAEPVPVKRRLESSINGSIDILHSKLQGILDGTMDVEEVQNDGSEVVAAEYHCEKADDVVSDLQMRLAEISAPL